MSSADCRDKWLMVMSLLGQVSHLLYDMRIDYWLWTWNVVMLKTHKHFVGLLLQHTAKHSTAKQQESDLNDPARSTENHHHDYNFIWMREKRERKQQHTTRKKNNETHYSNFSSKKNSQESEEGVEFHFYLIILTLHFLSNSKSINVECENVIFSTFLSFRHSPSPSTILMLSAHSLIRIYSLNRGVETRVSEV